MTAAQVQLKQNIFNREEKVIQSQKATQMTKTSKVEVIR